MFFAILFFAGMIFGNQVYATHISKPIFTMNESTYEPESVINISGWVNYNDQPTPDVLLLVKVINSENKKILEVSTTSDSKGNFVAHYTVPKNASGNYIIEVTSFCKEEHRNICTKQTQNFPITILNPNQTEITIPNWIRSTALWWSNGEISDEEFINAIQFLINEKILQISSDSKSEQQKSQSVPTWIKDTAGWWATKKVSDSDFVRGLKWLIENGILRI